MKRMLIASTLVSMVGVALLSCAPMQKYDHEVLSSTSVNGESFEMVRRTPLDEDGQPISGAWPEPGILDPSSTFHPCVAAKCTDADLAQAALSYDAAQEKREGGGDGGDGGGGGGGSY